MLADQMLGRCLHGRHIHGSRNPPRPAALHHQGLAPIYNTVQIMPGCGGEARVEVIIDGDAIQHGDRIRP